jgi:hypothetical protein
MRSLLAASLGLALGLVVLLTPSAEVQAAKKPQNPYSSFNLSGINYGSQQWAKSHSGSSSSRRSFRGFRSR